MKLNLAPGKLAGMQHRDFSLSKIREHLKEQPMEDRQHNAKFYYQDGILYRTWRPQGAEDNGMRGCEQLVLPWEVVLKLAHEVPLAGHLGVAKTKDRILQRYYWPGIFRDVARFCRSCEVCQQSTSRKPRKVEMVSMPLMTRPFQRIALDIVGPR